VSSATAYLDPAKSRANLELVTNAHSSRVTFDGTRATGIEYLRGGSRHVAKAHKEVLLAAGSMNTPQLLELSGIGDAALLKRLNIPVIVNSPAVGNGLQDHLAASYFYRSKVPTLNNQLAPFIGKVKAALRYAFTRGGPLSMSVNQAGAFLRGRPDRPRPNLHIYFNPASYSVTTVGPRRRLLNPDPFAAFLMSFNSTRPTSRGFVHIRCADPLEPPAIQPNALSTEEDIAEVYEGARLLRRISGAQPLAGIIESEMKPGANVLSDEQVLQDFRERAGSVFHSCSTATMGPDPQKAVVDARLKVYGVTGLRVVDASVFPAVTSGNINTPTLMVAEKAADLILQS
jgi:choline dehydrogenase